jgi:hypothetical protein
MGPYLRYIGIDDLPRLFNVLRGEMSIIDGGAHSPSFLNQTSAPPWLPLAVDEPVDIETTGTRVVYENKSIRVREDTIRRRDGPSGIYSVVEKPHFVVNVPVEGDGRLHLVEQFRYPVRGRYIGNSPGLLGAGTRGRPAGSGARRITGGDWSRRRHDVLCRPSL